MLFYFLYDDLSFINTTQKPSKKNISMPRMDEKNFMPGNFTWRVAAETLGASCFKKYFLENNKMF